MFANDFYSVVIPHFMRKQGFSVKVKIPKKIESKTLRAVHPCFIVRDTGWDAVDDEVGETEGDILPVDVNNSDHIGDDDTHSYNFPRKIPGEHWHHNNCHLTHRM